MYIDMNTLSWILLGVFLVLVLFPFIYRENLERIMRGKLLAEFWDSSGERDFVPCKILRRMMLPITDDKGNKLPQLDKDGNKILNERNEELYVTQLVMEIEPPASHKKLFPNMGNYFTKRECVDRVRYPNRPFMWSAMSIRVQTCTWPIGCIEPSTMLDRRVNYPITTSAGFVAGLREHDILEQAHMMVESMKGFAQDLVGKFQEFAKGTLNKRTVMILFIVIILLVGISIGISFIVMTKLSLLVG